MELEVVAGGHDGMLVGCSVDLLQEPEHQVLRKKYHEKGHDGIIGCVASGGRYLASGGADETIQLYDMRKHVNVGTLLHHEASITCLCFHKETHLLSASEDGAICLWHCGRGWDLLHTLSGHKYSVTSLSVHPTGKLALSVGRDRTVRTWNLGTGRAAFTLRLPKAADLVEWSPIGDYYVLAVGGTLMVYSVESGECVVSIEVEKQINSIVFVQDSVVALGTGDPDILLYSTSTGKELSKLSGHTNRVKGLAVSPDSSLLFSVSSDGAVKAWSLPKPPKSLVHDHHTYIAALHSHRAADLIQEDGVCVSTLDTGLRLTSVTALLPEKLSEGGGGGGGGGGKRRGEKKTKSAGGGTGLEEFGHKNRTVVQDKVKPSREEDTATLQEQDSDMVRSPGQTVTLPSKKTKRPRQEGEGEARSTRVKIHQEEGKEGLSAGMSKMKGKKRKQRVAGCSKVVKKKKN